MQLQAAPLRLKLVDVSGTPVVILPPPMKGGMLLEFVEKKDSVDLMSGAERTRKYGYIPVLTIKYDLYFPAHFPQYAAGVTDGKMPVFDDLLILLSKPTGTLKISPGLSNVGWINVDSVQVKGISLAGIFPSGLEIVFRGRDILSTMALPSS